MFKKMLRAFGVGGPSVDTVLTSPEVTPGQPMSGKVLVSGGDHDVEIEQISVALETRVETEGADTEYEATVEFARVAICGAFSLPAGAHREVPFTFAVPWETPVTSVYGQPLHGMVMGLRTELAVAKAVDKGDLDPVRVHPTPAAQTVLDAISSLGFRFKSADLERGVIRGIHQTLPFYQEIEFFSAAPYAHRCNELELTLVANQHGAEVVLEVDKRGGLFTEGHDVYHHFQVPHAGAQNTNWAAMIDEWLRRALRV